MRTTASAVEGLCQACAIESRMCSDLGSVKRSYFIHPNAEGENSLSVRALDHPSPSDAPSVVLVKTKKCVRVMNKPDNLRYVPASLRGARALRRRLGRSQRVAEASVCMTAVHLRCP